MSKKISMGRYQYSCVPCNLVWTGNDLQATCYRCQDRIDCMKDRWTQKYYSAKEVAHMVKTGKE